MTDTLKQEIAEYIAGREGAPATIRVEQHALERYTEFVAGYDVPHPPDLRYFRAVLRDSGLGASSINLSSQAVERLYRWIGEQGRLPVDSPYLEAKAGTIVRAAIQAERHPRPDFASCDLAAAVESWLRYNRMERLNRLNPKTLENYGRSMRYWGEFLASKGIGWRDAGRTDVWAFVRWRRETIARRSVVADIIPIRRFYQWATAEGTPLTARPGDQIPRLRWKSPFRRRPPYLQQELIGKLLAVYRDSIDPRHMRNQAILELLYASGLRVSELTALDLFDVDLDGLTIRVRHGKGDKERIAFLHERAAVAVERYLEHGRPQLKPSASQRAIFLGYRGTRITPRGVEYIVTEAGDIADIGHITPHVLRYSFATALHEGGMDLRMIQELMGHTDMEMTSRYIGVSMPRLANVVEESLQQARTARRQAFRRAARAS